MNELKRNPLTEEQKKLIEDNLGYIISWFNKFHIYNEDHQQDYLYAVCKYINLYDPSRGAITTFLNAVLISRRSTISRHETNLTESLNKLALRLNDILYEEDDYDPITVADAIMDSYDGFSEFETNEVYKDFLNRLEKEKSITPHQLKVFLTYLQVNNIAEVCRIYNCSRQNIDEIINKVRNKIKKKKLLRGI